jgi:hypothetical protein
MLPVHVRFPLLAISTDPRRVGVACVDHRLELVDARVHDTRRFSARSPEFVAFVEKRVLRDILRFRARTIIIEAGARAGPGRRLVVVAAVQAARSNDLAAAAVDPAEALVSLDVPSLRSAVEKLAGRYVRCRRPCPAHVVANDRPLLTAIVLAHAVGLASLSAEA